MCENKLGLAKRQKPKNNVFWWKSTFLELITNLTRNICRGYKICHTTFSSIIFLTNYFFQWCAQLLHVAMHSCCQLPQLPMPLCFKLPQWEPVTWWRLDFHSTSSASSPQILPLILMEHFFLDSILFLNGLLSLLKSWTFLIVLLYRKPVFFRAAVPIWEQC